MDNKTKETYGIIPALRDQKWIQTASSPPVRQKRIAQAPMLHSPPAKVAIPVISPVRERKQIVGVLEVRGLIPHIARLISDVGVLKSASVAIEKVHGRVYLCRFDVVARPDPVLPIVGLHWPRSVWDGHTSVAIDIVQTLRRAYADVAWALMNYPGIGAQRGSIHERRFQRAISEGTNDLLGVLANGSDEICTDGEYKFIAHHLLQAARTPEVYR